MFNYAIFFLVVALVAALFGFGLIATAAIGLAKLVFFIFMVLFIISLLGGFFM